MFSMQLEHIRYYAQGWGVDSCSPVMKLYADNLLGIEKNCQLQTYTKPPNTLTLLWVGPELNKLI